MHCTSYIWLVSGLLGVAVAPPPLVPPPPNRVSHKTTTVFVTEVISLAHSTENDITTLGLKTPSTSVAKVTTIAQTAENDMTTLGLKTTSTSVAKVTTIAQTTENDVTTLGDVVAATLVEIGEYPPEEVWTTIHRGSSSSTPGKIQSTSNSVQAAEKKKSTKLTMKGKATNTAKIKVAPTHVAPPTCTTYYPTIMRQISETFPSVTQEDTANTTKSFHVGQSVSLADKAKFNRLHQYVAFENITAGSWDCQLMVSWPDVEHGGIKVTSSSQRGSAAASGVSLEVYSASYDTSAYKGRKGPFTTWDAMMNAINAPGNRQRPASDSGKGQEKSAVSTSAQLTYFGTVPVNPGEYGLTVNSHACPAAGNDMLQFLFEIPTTDSREASVSFVSTKEKGAGVYLIANC